MGCKTSQVYQPALHEQEPIEETYIDELFEDEDEHMVYALSSIGNLYLSAALQQQSRQQTAAQDAVRRSDSFSAGYEQEQPNLSGLNTETIGKPVLNARDAGFQQQEASCNQDSRQSQESAANSLSLTKKQQLNQLLLDEPDVQPVEHPEPLLGLENETENVEDLLLRAEKALNKAQTDQTAPVQIGPSVKQLDFQPSDDEFEDLLQGLQRDIGRVTRFINDDDINM